MTETKSSCHCDSCAALTCSTAVKELAVHSRCLIGSMSARDLVRSRACPHATLCAPCCSHAPPGHVAGPQVHQPNGAAALRDSIPPTILPQLAYPEARPYPVAQSPTILSQAFLIMDVSNTDRAKD